MAAPLVGVVIPTYNYGRFLAEAVASVQQQGVDDLEIIVVDDGSTDETPDVVAAIDEPRLRAVRIPNGGISAARNAGLDLVRGKYIAFLDADDRWVPGKLRRQLDMLESEPELGLVFTDFARFSEQGRRPRTQFDIVRGIRDLPVRPSRAGNGLVVLGDAFERLAPLAPLATWMQTVVIRRDQAGDIRFPPRRIFNEDIHYMYRVYRRVHAGFIPEPLVEVRRHGNNSYESEEDRLIPDAHALIDLLDEPLTPPHRRVLLERIGRAWSTAGYYHYWRGNGGTAIRCYLQALRYPGRRAAALRYLAAMPLRPLAQRASPRDH